jgi:hypothetical protein
VKGSLNFDTELLANAQDLYEMKPRIGRMWLHNSEQFEEETDVVADSEERTALIDVVAISRSAFSGTHEHRYGADRDGEPMPLKDRINILWVKWDNGIAYRVASGFVHEEDWKRLDLEEIDLVLGWEWRSFWVLSIHRYICGQEWKGR